MILVSEKGLAGKTTLLKQHLFKSNFNDTLSIFLHAPFQDRIMKSQITALTALDNKGGEHNEYLSSSVGRISNNCNASSFTKCEDGMLRMLNRKFRILTFETLSKNFVSGEISKFAITLDGKVFGSKKGSDFNEFLSNMFSSKIKNEGTAVELGYVFDGEVYFPSTNNNAKIQSMIGPKNSYQIFALYQRDRNSDSFISAIFYDESSGINFSIFNVKAFRNGIECVEGSYLAHIPESDSIDHLPDDKREKKFLFSLYNIRGATVDNVNAILFPALSSGNTFKGGKFSSDALSFIVYLSKRSINFVASDDYLKNVVEIDNMSSIHNVRTKLINEYRGTDNVADFYKDKVFSSNTEYGLNNLIDSIITDEYSKDKLTTVRGDLVLLNSVEKVISGENGVPDNDQNSSENSNQNDDEQSTDHTESNEKEEEKQDKPVYVNIEELKNNLVSSDQEEESKVLNELYYEFDRLEQRIQVKEFSSFKGKADVYIYPFISWSSHRFIPNTTLPSEYRINQYVDFLLLPLTKVEERGVRIEGFLSLYKMKFDHNNMIYFLRVHTTNNDETAIICAQNDKNVIDPIHYLSDSIRNQVNRLVESICGNRYDYLRTVINCLFSIRTIEIDSSGKLQFRELNEKGMISNDVYDLSKYSKALGYGIGGLEFDTFDSEIRSKYLG